MQFGPIPVSEAAGALLAHSVKAGKRTLKKGRLLGEADIAALTEAGIRDVVAVRLAPGEIGEDAAAERVARLFHGPGVRANVPFTGRVNLFAEEAGVLVFERRLLDRVNTVDESVTVATLEPYARVEAGQMVATAKIIPFATSETVLRRVEAIAAPVEASLMRVAPFRAKRVALIQSTLPNLKPSVLDKTVGITRDRLTPLGATLTGERRCDHTAEAIAEAVREALADKPDIVLIAGASAIVDRRDALPAGVVEAGGRLHHFGMPVDPGNMILVAEVDGLPVLGLPGCCRSPKLNGFDFVLARLCAELPVGPQQVMAMGAGGLLAEIPSRGHPRATLPDGTAGEAPRAPRIAALVLAAGRSSRMGTANKLLQPVAGKPMLAHTLDAIAAAKLEATVVVTGHETDAISPLLAGRDLLAVHNPNFAAGLSTSLKAGLRALPRDIDGVIVCLG
ncbi:MAG: molybdopterin-binding/glycosyltransferase family 2 protein, partial [Alphaproteobacteria bacterium]|nr:molybdopterin-binding/glycosyltransferase family 2 protein [Alphaproteobacteria bacterium]